MERELNSECLLAALAVTALASVIVGCGASNTTPTPRTRAPSRLLVLNRRIGPISFGETRARIEAAFGAGHAVTLEPSHVAVVLYSPLAIGVSYARNQKGQLAAAIVETAAGRYRTRSGVGVGSATAMLSKAGVNCNLSPGTCQISGSGTKAIGTTFFLDPKSGRVARIVISTFH